MKTQKSSKKCKWYPICPITYYIKQGLLDPKWGENYCLIGNHDCIRYQMEEQGKFHPDQMLPDGTIDKSLP